MVFKCSKNTINLKNSLRHFKGCEIASFQQSARCSIVAQLHLARFSSEVGRGEFIRQIIEDVNENVMKNMNGDNEKHWINFRVKPEEYRQIHRNFSSTTSRKLSDYARKVLLDKPVVVKYRNQSADEFLSAMIPLKNELNAIGKNFNQAVKELHTLSQVHDFRIWISTYESEKQNMLQKVDEIKTMMQKIYEKWLQE